MAVTIFRRLNRSRAALSDALIVGSREPQYAIRAGYRHRKKIRYFDDTKLSDEYQNEVYETAAKLAGENDARLVYDVGCGSGFKLIKYFSEMRTVGFDVEPTLSFLRTRYPDREWRSSDFNLDGIEQADVVICSDVIEHVSDPDALLMFLKRITKSFLVLSTPDRDLVYSGRSNLGPPANPTHVREWSFREFREYIASHFVKIEQCHSNASQATQMIICDVRARREK